MYLGETVMETNPSWNHAGRSSRPEEINNGRRVFYRTNPSFLSSSQIPTFFDFEFLNIPLHPSSSEKLRGGQVHFRAASIGLSLELFHQLTPELRLRSRFTDKYHFPCFFSFCLYSCVVLC
ncbi:hypothetical protein LR48_Vigan743s000800 [Vigna angularis]|uniref:Uncharacterized protein n=1 Tax=Phaseolus angularis TaxID=3914 RepID=A0A0L9TGK4_PHAAN|nr:hypothetical protein LR48_Vigan743s000800 [Vigna angularis]